MLLGLVVSIRSGYIARAIAHHGNVAATGGEIEQPGFLAGLIGAVVRAVLVLGI